MRSCTFYDFRNRLCCTECGATIDLCKCESPAEAAVSRLHSEEGRFLRETFDLVQDRENLPRIALHIHLIEQFGKVGVKLVAHTQTRSPAPSEIRRDLVRLAALCTILASEGTPEYAYPAE